MIRLVRVGLVVLVAVGLTVAAVVRDRHGGVATTTGATTPTSAPDGAGDDGVVSASPGQTASGRGDSGGAHRLDGARSEEGARLAAVGFLELSEDVVQLSPSEAAEVQRGVSTSGAGDRLAGEVEAAMGELAARAPEGVEVWVGPLSVRSRQEGEGWEVSIWYVQVLVVGSRLAVASWHTATYSLEWEATLRAISRS